MKLIDKFTELAKNKADGRLTQWQSATFTR